MFSEERAISGFAMAAGYLLWELLRLKTWLQNGRRVGIYHGPPKDQLYAAVIGLLVGFLLGYAFEAGWKSVLVGFGAPGSGSKVHEILSKPVTTGSISIQSTTTIPKSTSSATVATRRSLRSKAIYLLKLWI